MINYSVIILFFSTVISVDSLPSLADSFGLSIVHVNDFHSRFEETDQWGDSCDKDEQCIGGFSRMFQTIWSLKQQNPDSLILNAGDNFQGTVWYTIFKWNVTQHFLNKIPFDAYTLGNHEFDDSVDNAVTFMKHLKAPIVLANVDDSLEPTFQGHYTKSIIVERNGKKIGIIGVLLKNAMVKSKIGKLKLLEESKFINAEAEKLVKEHNVFTNIVVSHSGYHLEQEMAKNATGKISVIVGGHTHSLLWNGDNPPSQAEKPEGPYPTVVISKEGKKVLVVQAQSMARYVGNITVHYNPSGDVMNWSGTPIFQNSSLPENREISDELVAWKSDLDALVNKVIGQSLSELSSTDCRRKECTLGNFVADALVYYESTHGGSSNHTTIAVLNNGGIKQTIRQGNVTYRNILDAAPFNNNVVSGIIKGKFITEALEHALEYFAEWTSRLLQVSGIKVTYHMRKPEGKRITSLQVRCSNCTVPAYSDILPNEIYNLVTVDYLTLGGDGFFMLRDNLMHKSDRGRSVECLLEYVSKNSPIRNEIEGRITVEGDENIKSKYRK